LWGFRHGSPDPALDSEFDRAASDLLQVPTLINRATGTSASEGADIKKHSNVYL
jgi:hypothetical protein